MLILIHGINVRLTDLIGVNFHFFTGFDVDAVQHHIEQRTTFADFFAAATLDPKVTAITGTVCGVRVEEIDDPLMQQIRYLDKLVDELAKGRPLSKVLRT